jgi:hypothetical protein
MSGAEASRKWVTFPQDDVRTIDLRRAWRQIAGDRLSNEGLQLPPWRRLRPMNNPPPNDRRGPGRRPGWGMYPTRESLMKDLVPAYFKAQDEADGEQPPMKRVVLKFPKQISRDHLKTLRYKFGIPWPPVALLLAALGAGLLGIDIPLPVT